MRQWRTTKDENVILSEDERSESQSKNLSMAVHPARKALRLLLRFAQGSGSPKRSMLRSESPDVSGQGDISETRKG